MALLAEVEAVGARLKALVRHFDAACVSGTDAALLVNAFAEVERLGAAGKTLAAGRVERSNTWKQLGEHRSAAGFIAAATGTTPGAAMGVLETARHLEELPVIADAFCAGALSEAQVREVAAAAAANPKAETDLLHAARTDSVTGLRERCRRVKAAAQENELDAYERIRRRRYFRGWTEPDGAVRVDGRFTPDAGAALFAAVEARTETVFADARATGRREPRSAYAADALVDLATEKGGTDARGGPGATVHVRVDHAALVRGHLEGGEVCEIPGVGPIPVAIARALLEDSILKVLVTKGEDVVAIAHAGRTIPARLRTALQERYPTCDVEGCDARQRLQIHHVVPVCEGGATTMANLRRRCSWHHYLTHHARAGPDHDRDPP